MPCDDYIVKFNPRGRRGSGIPEMDKDCPGYFLHGHWREEGFKDADSACVWYTGQVID